jgi:hypothetical protein
MFVEFQEISGGRAQAKPGTGGSLHTQEPVTVASFRTWRGWREYVARDRCLTAYLSIPRANSRAKCSGNTSRKRSWDSLL